MREGGEGKTFGRGAQLVGDGEEKWEVSQLLFADDSAGCGQQEQVGEVGEGVW